MMLCPSCSNEIKESAKVCPHCKRDIKQEVVQNWKSMIEQVVLGYEEHKGLVHGLQKDAIQNGWGQRLSKRGSNWAFVFELIKGFDSKYLLAMTDVEGYGLTGRNLETHEIPEDLPEFERLARFEHMHFSGESAQSAGLFGRGKLLFTAASQDGHIIYDSLTNEGIYRLNERKLEGRRFTNYAKAFEGENAIGMLTKLTRDKLTPLDKSGTRITIVNPKDEIVEAIKDGSFINYVEETWWQILLKYGGNGAKIIVKTDKKTQEADVPKQFKDVPVGISVEWKSKAYPLTIKYNGSSLRIKKVHFIVAPNPIPSELQGVYLYRREMKVADLGLRDIPDKIADKLYGYVEIETKSEFERIYLEENIEGPEHYSINRNKGLIRKFRKEVQLLFDRFKSELGFGVDSAKIAREKTRRAMSDALKELNKRMGELGISMGKTTQTRNITVKLEKIFFPRNSNKLEIGDLVKGISYKISNKSDWEHKVNTQVFTKDPKGRLIETLFDNNLIIKKNSFRRIGPFSFQVLAEKYPNGVEINLCCIVRDALSNKILAKKIIPIFISIDPQFQIGSTVELKLESAVFPRGSGNKRVNYGEIINNITYLAINKSSDKINLRYKARILNALVRSQEIGKLYEEDLVLMPFEEKEIKCPNIEVSKEKYVVLDREKGPVILRSSLIALSPSHRLLKEINLYETKKRKKASLKERKDIADSLNLFDKGAKLTKSDLKYWVNMDSGKGVFEEYRDFHGGPNEPRSKMQPEGEGFICLLNSTHPAYENIFETGDDFAIQSYTYEQLLRQTLVLLIRKDILEYWPEIEGKKYKNEIEDQEAETYEKIESWLGTLDYLYGEYLK